MNAENNLISEKKRFWRDMFAQPGKLVLLWISVYAVAWTLQAALTQNVLPLDAIETIVWGEQMQWGYMKHPPFSGWMGYFFSWASGYHDWALYFAAQLCVVSGVMFTYLLAREFFDKYEAATAALLICFLHYYTPPAMKFCSHDVEIALLPAMTFFFCKAVKEDSMIHWILFGTVSAIAFLGKYSAAQMFPACFIYLITTYRSRTRQGRRFFFWGSCVSALVFLLLISPHLYWLKHNGWYPILHLDDRINAMEPAWYEPLEAIGTILMPYVLELAVLFLLIFPWKNINFERKPLNRNALYVSLLFTIIPCAFFLGISFCGESIVMAWFSFLASLTGITAVAIFPWKIDKRFFRRVCIVLSIYTAIMIVATTADNLYRPGFRIHSEPEEIIRLSEEYVKSQGGNHIGTVYGYRWLAGVIQNYSPSRPPSCPFEDICDFELIKDKMKKEGVLLISTKDDKQGWEWLYKQLDVKPVSVQPVKFVYRTKFGIESAKAIYLGWIPPQNQQ